jgi:hypothetical protein
MLGTIGAEEPSTVVEALRNEKWVTSMNNEHTVLLKKKDLALGTST